MDKVRVLILGAGGHAQVVNDILLRCFALGSNYQPIGFLDDNIRHTGTTLMGLPVLGPITRLHEFDHEAVIVAIGDNHARKRIFVMLQVQGIPIVSAVHPAAVLAPDIHLGEGVMICAGVVVNTGTVVGDNVILNTACSIDHHNYIKSHAHIAPGTHLGGDIHVGEGALVGIGVSVIPGRSIGDWATVGAGAVVIRDVPPFATAVGVPARFIKQHEP